MRRCLRRMGWRERWGRANNDLRGGSPGSSEIAGDSTGNADSHRELAAFLRYDDPTLRRFVRMKRAAYMLSALTICLTHITLGQRASLQPLKPIGVAARTHHSPRS